MMEMSLLPALFRGWARGDTVATPIPPPTQTTVPKFSISLFTPSGPTTSSMRCPTPKPAIFFVEAPTAWKMTVMSPVFLSKSATVRGILSA